MEQDDLRERGGADVVARTRTLDHDTICAFRRNNGKLLAEGFAQVLEMAARCGVLKVGGVTVAIDGTKILANASKHAAVSYERAGEQMKELEEEIAALLGKAEDADSGALGRSAEDSR